MSASPRSARREAGARFSLMSRGLAAVTAAVAVPGAVLALGAASPGASAATIRPAVSAKATPITWHKLPLRNGWHSSQADFSTGDPAWALRGGIVYLAGSAHQSGGTAAELAVLPKAVRPAHLIKLSVYTYQDTTGTLTIRPDGAVSVASTPASAAQSYTSLAAISFPVAPTAEHSLKLLNGWQPNSGSATPAYASSDGIVYLSGALRQPSGTNWDATVLPKADRPGGTAYVSMYTPTADGQLKINPNGQVWAFDGTAQALTSLDTISFPAASVPRHPLALINGWRAGTGGTPSYSVVNGVVYLSGSINEAVAGPDEFAVLPASARPAHVLYIKAYTWNANVGTLVISPDGSISAYSPTAVWAQDITSLTSISFPVKS